MLAVFMESYFVSVILIADLTSSRIIWEVDLWPHLREVILITSVGIEPPTLSAGRPQEILIYIKWSIQAALGSTHFSLP